MTGWMVHDDDLFELAQAAYSQRKGRTGSNFPLSAQGSKSMEGGLHNENSIETVGTPHMNGSSLMSPTSPLSPHTPHTPAHGQGAHGIQGVHTSPPITATARDTSRSTARSTARRPSFMHISQKTNSHKLGSGGSQLSVTSHVMSEVPTLTKLDIHDSPNLTFTGLENLSAGRLLTLLLHTATYSNLTATTFIYIYKCAYVLV